MSLAISNVSRLRAPEVTVVYLQLREVHYKATLDHMAKQSFSYTELKDRLRQFAVVTCKNLSYTPQEGIVIQHSKVLKHSS